MFFGAKPFETVSYKQTFLPHVEKIWPYTLEKRWKIAAADREVAKVT